jgi:hypothetical protein
MFGIFVHSELKHRLIMINGEISIFGGNING